jgi:oligopeptidase B
MRSTSTLAYLLATSSSLSPASTAFTLQRIRTRSNQTAPATKQRHNHTRKHTRGLFSPVAAFHKQSLQHQIPNMSASSTQPNKPPIAKREEDRVVLAGKLPPNSNLIRQSESSTHSLLDPPRPIPDPYGWIRDDTRTNSDVVNHLKAENAYTEQVTHHLADLRESLYNEMIASIQETDHSTPAPRNGKFWYYTRTNQGESYNIYCRAPIEDQNENDNSRRPDITWNGNSDSPILPNEQVYLNVNALAQDKSYCSVSSVSVSPDTQKLLCYAVDFTGDEIYSIHVQNLETGEVVDQDHHTSIECSSVTWGCDSKTLFYVKMDDAHRPFQVYKRILGSKPEDDELIFEQPDDIYWTSIYKSSDYRYLFINTSSSETSEVYYLDLKQEENNDNDNAAAATLQRVAEKRQKVLYDVEHFDGSWIINSNVDETPNMRLMTCPVGSDCAEDWVDMKNQQGDKLFDGGYDRSLDRVVTFEKYLVATGREGGIPRVWVIEPAPYATSTNNTNENDLLLAEKCTQLIFDETAYDVGVGANYDYSTEKLTLYYDSMRTPLQSLQITLNDPNNMNQRIVLKQKKVPGYDKSTYGCDRITVKVRDGTEVPVSMVYRKDVMEKYEKNGEKLPVHLVGYGSYGACSEADFSATRLSLLNRGIVYAMAHIRGG